MDKGISMEKNILARVEEKHVLAALRALPHPEDVTKDEFQETVIEVPRLGHVRFTCYRIVGAHGDYRWAFWAPVKAARVEWGH